MESIEHYMTKYNDVTSWRQEKCTRKYVTICIRMALELHARSLPSAAHKLLLAHNAMRAYRSSACGRARRAHLQKILVVNGISTQLTGKVSNHLRYIYVHVNPR